MLSPISSSVAPTATSIPDPVLQAGFSLYESVVSGAYSVKDRQRLAELKRLYQEILLNKPPVVWDLDDKYKPTQRISPHKWSDHLRQLIKSKNRVGNFFYQARLIAEYAATYLTERSGRLFFANGKAGDVLEQFMGEWITFAIQELATFNFDDSAIEKIMQRIRYVERIQKHEFLFKFGSYTRSRNKFDTMESIRQQLYAAGNFAQTESLRQCAREKLKICCINTACLLVACVNSIYYARGTIVYHEPFNLEWYLDSGNSSHTATARDLYSAIKMTHTGAMLFEVMSKAGLGSFGTTSHRNKETKAVYFDTLGVPQAFKFEQAKHDFAPWITAEVVGLFYQQTQEVLESVLRICQLKQLAETAFDLTGSLGDVWAYGDKEGKLSLEALLFLFEKELAIFYGRYEKYYRKQNELRQEHFNKKRFNPDQPVSKNYNKLDEQYEDIKGYYDAIKKALKSINEKIGEFTEEDEKKVNLKKRLFYKSLAQFFKQYYPTQYNKYEALDQPSIHIVVEESESQLHRHACQFLANDRKLESEADLKFTTWRTLFVKRHKEKYKQLQKLKAEFYNAVEANFSEKELQKESRELYLHLESMKKMAESEKPRWSLKTAGWPFNQDIKRYITAMIRDYDHFLNDLTYFLGQPNSQIQKESQEVKAPVKVRQQVSLQKFLQRHFGFFSKPALASIELDEKKPSAQNLLKK